VNTTQAVDLIRDAVHGRLGVWADLGAGDGTFTRALAELLGPGSRVYAVDRDARTLATLGSRRPTNAAGVTPVVADITRPFELPGLEGELLDGMLLANSLHFVRDADAVLASLASLVRPGGRMVLVEYDRRTATRWVPYPIPIARLPELAAAAGLSVPVVTATQPSIYEGVLYAAAADRLD
jgi:SAM-dependent methyltransferase